MPARLVRRASLTALVFAALAAQAAAETVPPGAPGDRTERADPRFGPRHGMRMYARAGGILQMFGVVPMRPGSRIEFSEGRLAFLKAELKITDAQSKAWDAFAGALRENVTKLNDAYALPQQAALDKMGPADRLAWIEKALAARLEAVRRAKAALEPLYGALSDDQKKVFGYFVPTGAMRDRMRDRMRRHFERRGDGPAAPPGQPGRPPQQ